MKYPTIRDTPTRLTCPPADFAASRSSARCRTSIFPANSSCWSQLLMGRDRSGC